MAPFNPCSEKKMIVADSPNTITSHSHSHSHGQGDSSSPPDFCRRYVNLASSRLGAKAIFATDEFFAAKERMLNPESAVFYPDKYDDHGKWMDGWETRRRRTSGYDYCVVRLARAGVIHGVVLDTSHFTGNFPPAASLDGCYCPNGVDPSHDYARWVEVLPSVPLRGDTRHHHEILRFANRTFTHVRLNIFPDGGMARLRVFCAPKCDWENDANYSKNDSVDLAAMENGAYIVAANDYHYGKPSNLLLPGRGVNMGDGWETRRRREPGNDWCIIALAHPGTIDRIEVDTAHFKGNYPDRCSFQAAFAMAGGAAPDALVTQSMFWPFLLPERKLEMDKQHYFDTDKLAREEPVTHVRFNIIPDGGVSRIRLWGRLHSYSNDTKPSLDCRQN